MRSKQPLELPENVNSAWRIGIVASFFYEEEMNALVDGAQSVLTEAGIDPNNILLFEAPGSFEVPLIGEALAEAQEVDALIGLGIIVEGETHHARLLADQASRGIMDVQLRHRVPFAFEILYVDDLAQVNDRLNKGGEAAVAVLKTLAILDEIES